MGVYAVGPMAVGHALLSITPESAGETSPWRSSDGQCVIAFDGRLDHRESLWAALGIAPDEHGLPDPELILRAHAKWGNECVNRLDGEFAFALWDARRQELLCAVDVFGRRDLFYHCHRRRFTFGSRIRSLLVMPEVPCQLDELALGCDLSVIPRPSGRTLYADIHRLPGAHWLTVRPGGTPRLHTYWQLRMEPLLDLGSHAAYAEALREKLEQAVRSALRSRHPVAVMLSGGLDSTGLTGLAAGMLAKHGRPLISVSGVLAEEASDAVWDREESPFIREALAKYPLLDPCWAHGNAFPALRLDDGWYETQDEPDWDPFSYRALELAMLARQRGARIVLGGMNGDMAASYDGRGLLEQLFWAGRWADLAGQLRAQSAVRSVGMLTLLRSGLIRPLAPAWLRRGFDWWRGDAQSRPPQMPIAPEFAARLPLADWMPDRRLNPATFQDHRVHHMELANSGRFHMRCDLLSRLAPDLESPQPWSDRRVWEWCYRVPLEEFVPHGLPRGLYRNALRDVLPAGALRRTTKGWFAPDFARSLAAAQETMTAFMQKHGADHTVWNYVNRPVVLEVLEQLGQRTPGQWDRRYQSVLCLGLRLADFIARFG